MADQTMKLTVRRLRQHRTYSCRRRNTPRVDLDRLRGSYIKNACKNLEEDKKITGVDLDFLCEDARLDRERALELLALEGVGLPRHPGDHYRSLLD